MNVANKAIIRKLALSQLKINRRRTIWTILGIVLSTAMITAVYGFAASGYAAIVDLLGENTVSQNYLTTIGSISVVLSMVIIAASVIVISNAFRVSADERTRQFGLLKCVGTTKKQIIRVIMNEGIILSVIAVPFGIILGLLVQFGALQFANFLLTDINDMNVNKLAFDFVVAWQAILISAVLAFITIMLSAWLPARKAAKVPVVDAIRGTGEVNVKAKQIRANPIVKMLFGVEGTLASKSFKRNKRNLRATVISLAISIIMFVAASSFGAQMGRMADLVFHLVDANVIGTFQSEVKSEYNDNGGRLQKYSTIFPAHAESITARLRNFPETTVFGAGVNNYSFSTVVPGDMLSQELKNYFYQYLSADEIKEGVTQSVVLLTVDAGNYADLCKIAGVPVGSNILINYNRQRINENWTEITPFVFDGQTLLIQNRDDDSVEVFNDLPLHGVLGREAPNEVLWFAGNSITVLVPNLDSINYAWFATSGDPFAFEEYMYTVFDEMIPRVGEIPVSTFVSNGLAQENAQRSIYRLFMMFIFGFVAMLTLIGLTNVISTISTNVRLRSREFAVLRCIGMTHSGLYRMLNLESILCSVKSLIIGLPIGVAASYLIYRSIMASVDFPFEFPWLPIFQCILAVFIITWVIMRYSASKLRSGNIVEAIRLESGS
jgi:putative ABC transport system permease protein